MKRGLNAKYSQSCIKRPLKGVIKSGLLIKRSLNTKGHSGRMLTLNFNLYEGLSLLSTMILTFIIK
jgi:hypothetical protein